MNGRLDKTKESKFIIPTEAASEESPEESLELDIPEPDTEQEQTAQSSTIPLAVAAAAVTGGLTDEEKENYIQEIEQSVNKIVALKKEIEELEDLNRKLESELENSSDVLTNTSNQVCLV